jgi:catechol 2,3-dioxygenase-like lactoylglutathione lyase family enzyme
MPETMVPMLPCGSIREMLDFYTDLGFTITYQQKSPNVYAAVKRGAVELHFYVMKDHDPEQNWSTCGVMMDDPELLHATFIAALKQARGKAPFKGIPRITQRWRKGQSRFNIVDPAGNWIRFCSRSEDGFEWQDLAESKDPSRSRLATAIGMARRLRDGHGVNEDAARILDAALARPDAGSVRERGQAIVARAELAASIGEPDVFKAMQAAFEALELDEDDQLALQAEIEELAELSRESAA